MNTVTSADSSYYAADTNEKTEKGPCLPMMPYGVIGAERVKQVKGSVTKCILDFQFETMSQTPHPEALIQLPFHQSLQSTATLADPPSDSHQLTADVFRYGLDSKALESILR